MTRRSVSTAGPTTHSKFKSAERQWKSRTHAPDPTTQAFSCDRIVWTRRSSSAAAEEGGEGEEGVWTCGITGRRVTCRRIAMRGSLTSLDRKGKCKDVDTTTTTATTTKTMMIVIPSIPGLVLVPCAISPLVQRNLVRTALRCSILPNLTSLSAHYALPVDGLWIAHEQGRDEEILPRIDEVVRMKGTRRGGADFEPVTVLNWDSTHVATRSILPLDTAAAAVPDDDSIDEVEERREGKGETVASLLKKLRWTTIGWQYNWSSKSYSFDRAFCPVPALIQVLCQTLVRRTPWDQVFDGVAMQDDPSTWKEDYTPDGGVINFYQLRDSLTAHVDQSEVDAVRPLVSFSLGHSAIFLMGGETRDSCDPLPILLQSGDALMMSGPGRRLFHGLPRVLEHTLPHYLTSTALSVANEERIEQEEEEQVEVDEEWKRFGEYMEGGARINLNVRQVFPC